jgi:hypothetical protein
MPSYKYSAVEYTQIKTGTKILLLAAPCHEITQWAGIPRKEAKEGVTTIGFQRMADDRRLKKLNHFLSDPTNVIANPILCAVRTSDRFKFEAVGPDGDPLVRIGILTVTEPDFDDLTLVQLLQELERLLAHRKPGLKEIPPEEDQVTELGLAAKPGVSAEEAEPEEDEEQEEAIGPDGLNFSTESHIDDFYRSVLNRRVALERAGSPNVTEFAGFSKTALRDYLRAATVVDGQHRLLGAQEYLREFLDHDEKARKFQDDLLAKSVPADEVTAQAQREFARRLGIALIWNDDWAEHVFQFVVVNQKATPIPKALLGSIVATTLTDAEVAKITNRLGKADIPVVDYQVISYLEGSADSPFRGLIKRGYEKPQESEKKLEFSVASRLADTFRFLKGAKYFHDKDVDYAKKWATSQLPNSKIVADFHERGFKTHFDYWSSPDGPWREVFCTVWAVVRDTLGDTTGDKEAQNLWGYPTRSNLFNDVHLSILAADFFEYLTGGRGIPINSRDEVITIAEEWLFGAKKDYFTRNYGLKDKGIKKSENAVKVLWSQNWRNYRQKGYVRVPPKASFVPQ